MFQKIKLDPENLVILESLINEYKFYLNGGTL